MCNNILIVSKIKIVNSLISIRNHDQDDASNSFCFVFVQDDLHADASHEQNVIVFF